MNSLELFAGIGGIALAEQMAGINVAALSEMAEFPVKVLKKNFRGVPILPDVTKINNESLRKAGVDPESIDVISGGFPCQPFSIAGKRKGTEDDRDLWPEMFRIIQEIKPNWVVGENVANFANMELDRTLSNLESIGYETRTFILPALAIGAPHQRQRTFIVANANSKRWISMDKSIEERCIRKFTQGTKVQTGKALWNNASDVLSSGARVLTNSSSRVQRNDDGLSEGMDRLKALGNAVVPQQVLPIFKAIVEIENIDIEKNKKSILDVACGSRMFWFDKDNSNAIFMDKRKLETELSDGRKLVVNPDVIGDFRHIPFENNSFYMVVFDPPHLIHAGKNSWLAKKYGVLNADTWRTDLKQGFDECMRVLKPHGTLIFKWNVEQIPMSKILEVFGQIPLFGDKRSKTRWVVFMKK